MTRIRILEGDSNRRGDLFGRLMADVLLALGYDKARLNVHKAGREIDLIARHRTEPRLAVAECKATADVIGGGDFNKFFGVLDLERRRHPDLQTQGYFISLSGFRETALEQEYEAGESRFVTLDGEAVVEELVNGRILVAIEQATAAAGTCAHALDVSLDAQPELLALDVGWVWCIYFHRARERTHFALVHAGGAPLGAGLAAHVVEKDREVGGGLAELAYLAPPSAAVDPQEIIDTASARSRYTEYLISEFGRITLEGLPADQQVGSRQIPLEELFVPLRFVAIGPQELAGDVTRPESVDRAGALSGEIATAHDRLVAAAGEVDAEIEASAADATRGEAAGEPIADVLGRSQRIAVLASPGGGKSTLIKRLAVAYASADRRRLSTDALPERAWLPLVIRCRQLDHRTDRSIREVLASIPVRAEMPELREAFERLVADALVKGEVLLLIDGLDEIADERQRVAFVKQLRTFLSTYPTAAVVVTSRHAGFRIVGAALGAVCDHYRLADFNDDDIESLTVAWHREVVGGSAQTLAEARVLAARIIASDRVRRLARSPLLLTTLLLVKRWLGDLPRKRSLLYGKAIEVLLMTWNVEGYEPIEPAEALPQLAFVAYTMTDEGSQTVSAPRLAELLREAREQMPELLAYARIPVEDFVRRVEDRSSVLSLVGHTEEAGRLVGLYEFKHLTFQEYLTALAIAEGYYPGRQESDTLLDVLAPRLWEPSWREVVLLTAVLAGRGASVLVEHLVMRAREEREHDIMGGSSTVVVLARCLADEVQVAPPLVRDACEAIATAGLGPIIARDAMEDLLNSRFGATFEDVGVDGFLGGGPTFTNYGGAFGLLAETQVRAGDTGIGSDHVGWLATAREWAAATEQPRTQAAVAMLAMKESHYLSLLRQGVVVHRDVREYGDAGGAAVEAWLVEVVPLLVDQLAATEPAIAYTASWALYWRGVQGGSIPVELRAAALRRLFALWRESASDEVRDMAAYALAHVPLVERSERPLGRAEPEVETWLSNRVRGVRREPNLLAASLAGYYLGGPWSDAELLERAERASEDTPAADEGWARLKQALGGHPPDAPPVAGA